MPSGRRPSPWISPRSSSATSTASHAANRFGISTAGARTRSRRPRSSRRRSTAGRWGCGSIRSTSSSSPSTRTGVRTARGSCWPIRSASARRSSSRWRPSSWRWSGSGPCWCWPRNRWSRQWQGELDTLLGLPSAVWDGRQWVDERGVEHPGTGAESIRRCPRRIGIVSTGLVTRGSEAAELLEHMRFECVILDEAHRARRRSRGPDAAFGPAAPNNLLRFLWKISSRTKSLLLATATPVQLHPIEAYDLLDALARGSEAVLGGPGSRWRNAQASLDLVLGNTAPPDQFDERWEWWRNPLPPRSEGKDFQILRSSLKLPDEAAYAPGRAIDDLRPSDRQRIMGGFDRLVDRHNPYIRTIVLRTREYLETTLDPETGEPYLTPVRVRLHGESNADAIRFPPFLEEAYHAAETFCELLAKRENMGFFRTLLLRRMGSTMEAGGGPYRRSSTTGEGSTSRKKMRKEPGEGAPVLTGEERNVLRQLERALDANRERDPKYAVVRRLLVDEGWRQRGCIIFSQYFDSVRWLAQHLSGRTSGRGNRHLRGLESIGA